MPTYMTGNTIHLVNGRNVYISKAVTESNCVLVAGVETIDWGLAEIRCELFTSDNIQHVNKSVVTGSYEESRKKPRGHR